MTQPFAQWLQAAQEALDRLLKERGITTLPPVPASEWRFCFWSGFEPDGAAQQMIEEEGWRR